MKAKISCVDCDFYVRGRHGGDCTAFWDFGRVPVQGVRHAREVNAAWAACRGKVFVPRRPWWKRLLGLK